MPAQTRKGSRAKQFAEVERISVLGATAQMGPPGLWTYAAAYRRAATALPPTDGPFEPVAYFLVCHSIELALKAYLSLHGSTMVELSGGPFGHNLSAVLSAAETKGLHSLVPLSTSTTSEIRKADNYYAGKAFEYPAVGEAFRGYPDLPKLSLLLEAADHLCTGLAQACRDAA